MGQLTSKPFRLQKPPCLELHGQVSVWYAHSTTVQIKQHQLIIHQRNKPVSKVKQQA